MGNVIITRIMKTMLFAIVLLISNANNLTAQQWTWTGNGGVHDFQSLQQQENLSFYLFGDGYFSFEQNPRHKYEHPNPSLTVIPKHFSAKPYDTDDDDVEEAAMVEIINTQDNVQDEDVNIDMGTLKLQSSWEHVQGQDNYYILSFHNKGTQTMSGCVEFHYNKDDLDIDENEILDDYKNDWVKERDNETSSGEYSHKYTWEYENLKEGEQRHIYINAVCVPAAFSKIKTKAVIRYSYEGDGCNPHTAEVEEQKLRSFVKNNPHDPNCLVADPHALYECDIFQKVTYTAYFHNDGDDAVQDVLVALNNEAPISNIKLISSPDNVTMNWGNPNQTAASTDNFIDFTFPSIFLPGLNDENNPPASLEETYSQVVFEVCYDLSLFTDGDLDCSYIRGGISFDNEDPINISNNICRRIDCETGYIREENPYYVEYVGLDHIKRHCVAPNELVQYEQSIFDGLDIHSRRVENKTGSLKVYPNPAFDMLYLEHLDLEQGGVITITDVNGQILQTASVASLNGNNSIQVNYLSEGIYFLTVTTAMDRQTKRFVKQ